MRILVTGGAGFIGSALANKLQQNHEVTVLDDLSVGTWSRTDPSIRRLQINLDFVEFGTLVEILKDIDILCHLAAVKLHNEKNSIEIIENSNLLVTQKIALAAALAGVKKVLFTSSLYAYGNKGPTFSVENDPLVPYNDYGRSKKMGEEILTRYSSEFGFSLVIARPYFIYGPKQYVKGGYKSVITTNIERYRSGLPLIMIGSGRQKMDFVYIDDCIDALERLIEPSVQGTFNIASQEPVTVGQVIKYINIGEKSAIQHQVADWTEGTVRAGNSEKLRSELNWQPKISIAQGIRKILGEY